MIPIRQEKIFVLGHISRRPLPHCGLESRPLLSDVIGASEEYGATGVIQTKALASARGAWVPWGFPWVATGLDVWLLRNAPLQ